MFNPHDFLIGRPGADAQAGWYRFALDDQRVVTRRFEGITKSTKNAGTMVVDFTDLSMHQFFRSNNLAAKGFTDRLVAEADA